MCHLCGTLFIPPYCILLPFNKTQMFGKLWTIGWYFFHQTWDPLSSLSPSRLLAPKELPAPHPGFIDVAMILLGLQVEHEAHWTI